MTKEKLVEAIILSSYASIGTHSRVVEIRLGAPSEWPEPIEVGALKPFIAVTILPCGSISESLMFAFYDFGARFCGDGRTTYVSWSIALGLMGAKTWRERRELLLAHS